MDRLDDDPFNEPADAEPEEFDPQSLGPDIPEVDFETDTTFGATEEVSDELFRSFLGAVIFLNVALAALSIGTLLVYFRGDYRTGGAALAIGLVAALFTARYYWRFERRDRGRAE